ncbi:unnamed protein product [Arctia plantaginis]|uniref:Uncharacterized protein n=1 Tax=Arctia plantaginis TaxID=874455 RepID=A0A8S0Z2Z5_ARCPL|nr:unnamed protein product [Arctia plantaginis]
MGGGGEYCYVCWIAVIENKDYQWMCQRAMLAARNSRVDEIDDLILTKLPADIVTYTSIANVMDQEDAVHYREFITEVSLFFKPEWPSPTFPQVINR